jgi:hypothetical protein
MELLFCCFIVFFFVVLGWEIHRQKVRRKKAIEDAYAFAPQNTLGGARFAGNDDLRKGGLL